jgi:hypothetical protein
METNSSKCLDLVMVEAPYLTQDTSTSVFDHYGGIEAITKEIQFDKNHVHYNMKYDRSDNLNTRHELEGERRNTCGLLVRIRRKKKKNNDKYSSDDAVSVSIVGRALQSYHFDGLADFHFIPSSTTAPSISSSSSNKRSYGELGNGIAETVPSSFTGMHTRAPNGITNGIFHTEIEINATNTRKERVSNAIIVASGQPIPKNPGKSYFDVSRRVGVDDARLSVQALVAILKDLFARRPSWSRKQLESNEIASQRSYLLKELIPFESYYYNSGPLKDLWTRWDYDPSKNQLSRHYQGINVRLTSQSWQHLNKKLWDTLKNVCHDRGVDLDTLTWVPAEDNHTKGIKNLNPSIFCFGTEVKRQFNVQACNLCDEDMLEYVSKAKILSEWNTVTGWYSSKMLKNIRCKVLEIINGRADAFLRKHGFGQGSSTTLPISAMAEVVDNKKIVGFPAVMFDWQQRYEALPNIVANSTNEMDENDAYVFSLLLPEFRGEDGFERTDRKIRIRSTSSSNHANTLTKAANALPIDQIIAIPSNNIQMSAVSQITAVNTDQNADQNAPAPTMSTTTNREENPFYHVEAEPFDVLISSDSSESEED